MSNNPLSIPAQSNSALSSTNVNVIAKSSTNTVATKSRYETSKEAKNRVNKHRTNVKIFAAYSALTLGLFALCYLIYFYISKIPDDLKQQHLLGIIDYVKVNGIPAAFGAMVLGAFMWVFKDK